MLNKETINQLNRAIQNLTNETSLMKDDEYVNVKVKVLRDTRDKYKLLAELLEEKEERENPYIIPKDQIICMDGEPIYIVSDNEYEGWEIVRVRKTKNSISIGFSGSERLNGHLMIDYYKTWVAYKDKPKNNKKGD